MRLDQYVPKPPRTCDPSNFLRYSEADLRTESCTRCLQSRRSCSGYEDSTNFQDHQVRSHYTAPVSSRIVPRKCTLPVRKRLPGTDGFPADKLPTEVADEQGDYYCVQAVLFELCIAPLNDQNQPGFLAGLAPMIHDRGLHSNLAKACRAVGYASGGISLCRPVLTHRAEILYSDLLGELAGAVAGVTLPDMAELLAIVTLLGLYEVRVFSNSQLGTFAWTS